MRPERAPRASWLLASTSAAALVCWSGAAFATCTENNPGGVLALSGDDCVVSGSFATAVDDAILGQATGVGALISGPAVGPISFSTTGAASNALQADTGGAINLTPTLAAPGTVTTSGADSFGLFATGTGEGAGGPVASHINAFNLSVSTTGTDAFGAAATNGGFISLTGGSVMVSGDGSVGVNSNGAGSTVQASGVAVTTSGGVDSETGNTPVGVLAFNGGTITFAGGSITTTGASADAVASDGAGSSIALSGGTTILTTNNGSAGLVVVGSGAAATATGIAITTHGDEDTSDGFIPAGAYNGQDAADGFPSGGTMHLTNTVILTTGSNAPGIDTNSGGVTTISGGSVDTTGQDAHALFVTGSGSKANLDGAGSFSTAGAGAIGLAANQGGVISATGSISVTTAGGVSPATGFPAAGVAADGAGSAINLAAANITTSGPGAFGLVASDVLASGAAGTITATGTLNVQTKDPSAAAVALQGNGATITATGGGTITAAGNAIAFMGGTGQTATFDGFSIANLSGDLVFADPSTATLNFNATTANAGNNNLLNATGGSAITLNASASMLTGAIRTDAASVSNVNLTNNTTWTLTAPSTVTNLNVTHSIILFAPPGSGGAFKTLTVTNYAGNGANIAMNVALGGSGSAGDQIIINGGKATGSNSVDGQ